MTNQRGMPVRDFTFRELVQQCAKEPEIVNAFNKACKADLKAPITSLLQKRWPMSVSTEEEMQIGSFIMFVHEHVWMRYRRARSRLEGEH